MAKFKKGDCVIYKPTGDPGVISMVYPPGEKVKDNMGSTHLLPEGSDLLYDVFFMDRSKLWTVARASELKRYKGS